MASRTPVLLLAAMLCVTRAQARPSDFDPSTMMPVAEVQRGMKGYGLTVFHGTEIERFDVEILGALSKAILGADLILGKVTSGPVVERAGDLGLPVVIHDRLVDRTTDGTGAVETLTLAQIRRLDAGGWAGPGFRGERVPRFEEVLDLTRKRALLLVEAKTEEAAEQVVTIVRASR